MSNEDIGGRRIGQDHNQCVVEMCGGGNVGLDWVAEAIVSVFFGGKGAGGRYLEIWYISQLRVWTSNLADIGVLGNRMEIMWACGES